jgi:hypothetical protein
VHESHNAKRQTCSQNNECWSPKRKQRLITTALVDTTTVHSGQNVTNYPPAFRLFADFKATNMYQKLKTNYYDVLEFHIYVMRTFLVEYHLHFTKHYLIYVSCLVIGCFLFFSFFFFFFLLLFGCGSHCRTTLPRPYRILTILILTLKMEVV